MDYSDGTKLYKHQWDLVHDPENVNTLFEDEEESAMDNWPCTKDKVDVPTFLLAGDKHVEIIGVTNYCRTDETSEYGTLFFEKSGDLYFRYYSDLDNEFWYLKKGSTEWERKTLYFNNCTSCDLIQVADIMYMTTAKYGPSVAKIGIGVIAVAAAAVTGGTSLGVLPALGISFGVTSGSLSVVNGIAEITMNLNGEEEKIENLPNGTLDLLIGIPLKANMDNSEEKVYIDLTLTMVEGVITLKFTNPNSIQKIDNFLNGLNTSANSADDIIEILKNNDVEILEK